ncbi:M15 family metallopeptidase [Mesorhizobium sp. M0078]|uniref:M15 family metallopeptidase n=1 Tax=Mesorhizobium sp. M0078 TaxID=2956871 RepID=UPI00333C0205
MDSRRLGVIVFVGGLCVCLAATQGAFSETNADKTTSQPIPDTIWQKMQGKSWHADLPCPARTDLLLLTVPYTGFDGQKKTGHLIVAKAHAANIAAAMDRIFASGTFRIERMELVDKYGGDDDASMADNNTSAFNCRFVGGTNTLSAHALGIAIDINPVQNPFVTKSNTYPPAGKAFDEAHERISSVTGIILPGGEVTTSFGDVGWTWGGTWDSKKDYQHFSQSGK